MCDNERMRIMGKDLKGRNLGRGLSQRPDGRYMGRAQVNGKPIVLYDWKLKELKKSLAIAVDEAKRSNLMPDMDGKKVTLSEWFEEWYSKYKAPTLKNGGSPSYKRKYRYETAGRYSTASCPDCNSRYAGGRAVNQVCQGSNRNFTELC